MTGLLFSRVAVVILVMIATAGVVVLAWLAVRRLWQAIRPHPGGHTASRHDDYDEFAAFLGAPTADTIPVKDVDGEPPWEVPDGFYAEPLTAPYRTRWDDTDQTRAVVVDPGWDEPDTGAPGWAEIKLPSLDDMLGYAYPGGFPSCHHDPAQRADRLFDGVPWAADPGPASTAELDALRFELLETADLDADRVYALMGGDR